MAGLPPYARVLAATERGRSLLRAMDGVSEIPLITKPASVKTLDERARRVFALGADARDFYVLGHEAVGKRAAGTDWKTTPGMLP